MRAWIERFGGWQDELCWRLFGLNLLLLGMQAYGQSDESLGTYLVEMPLSYNAAALAGAALALLGPRMALLALCFVTCTALTVQNFIGAHPRLSFIADEYLVDALLPGLAVLVFVRGRFKPLDGQGLEDLRVAVRCAALVVLGCAALAKLNADFLDPDLSCANLAKRLELRFGVPVPSHPVPVLLMECAIPFLLVFVPRLGMAGTLVLATSLGHLGPAAFNVMLIGLAGLFWSEDHVEPVRRHWKRWVPAGLIVGLVGAGYSLSVYEGPMKWGAFGVLEMVVAMVGAALVASWVAGPKAQRQPVFTPGTGWGKSLRSWLLFALVLNGLTPYLGVKYRYSFAMLSNLRVDRARWNHLLVPSFVSLRPSQHVHVRVAATPKQREPIEELPPGMYTAPELVRRLDRLHGRGRSAYLEVEYGGEVRTVERSGLERNFIKYLESLPEGRLFQKQLADQESQICVH